MIGNGERRRELRIRDVPEVLRLPLEEERRSTVGMPTREHVGHQVALGQVKPKLAEYFSWRQVRLACGGRARIRTFFIGISLDAARGISKAPPVLTLEETRDAAVPATIVAPSRPAAEAAQIALFRTMVTGQIGLGSGEPLRRQGKKPETSRTTVYRRSTSPRAGSGKIELSMRTVPAT